jgi:hypothetical protein
MAHNAKSLLDLAAKLRKFASEIEGEGYRGLFLLSASALEERAFLLTAADATTSAQR